MQRSKAYLTVQAISIWTTLQKRIYSNNWEFCLKLPYFLPTTCIRNPKVATKFPQRTFHQIQWYPN